MAQKANCTKSAVLHDRPTSEYVSGTDFPMYQNIFVDDVDHIQKSCLSFSKYFEQCNGEFGKALIRDGVKQAPTFAMFSRK